MGWARIDDSFHDHPKLIGLSLEALGLWTKCLTWAHRHHGSSVVLGHIPADLPQMFAGTRGKRLASELCERALWDRDLENGGWNIHDYVDYLPAAERPQSASEVSKARSEAGRRGAEARWAKANESQTDGNLPSNGMANTDGKPMPPTRPDPTLVPTELRDGRGKRGTRLPPQWRPSPDMLAKAATEFPSVDLSMETDAFCDWFHAKAGKDGVKLDWDLTWQGWMRRTHRQNLERNPGRPNGQRYFGKPGERKSMY